jgi:hypothetical protein
MWLLSTPDLFRMMVTEKLKLTNHLEKAEVASEHGLLLQASVRPFPPSVSRNECGADRDRVPLFVVFTMHSRFDPSCDGDWGLGIGDPSIRRGRVIGNLPERTASKTAQSRPPRAGLSHESNAGLSPGLRPCHRRLRPNA